MGQEAAGHKLIHVARLGGKLQIGHVLSQLIDLLLRLGGQQHGVCAAQGGVTDVMIVLNRNIRKHTDIHGILHIDPASDATCYVNLLDHADVEVQALQHGTDR